MRVSSTRIVIVGGGLAGLYAAYLLEQRGITDYVLFEARPALGGRIQSLTPQGRGPAQARLTTDRFDVGPTWFWPAFQPELDQLVGALGLERFMQYETGDMMLERSPNEQPMRTFGYSNSSASVRLVGGMAALVEALHRGLNAERTVVGQTVHAVSVEDGYVDVVSHDATGAVSTVRSEQVLIAVPPRLAHEKISFSPPLPAPLARKWQHTATWMAPHAKYVAVYDTPFWREAGLSGEARSACGPLGEIHDASMPGGSAALFGFFAVPAAVRRGVSEEALIGHCRAQFARLFGPQAANPKAEFIKDWAFDDLTATATDQEAAGGHASPPPATVPEGDWRGRLVGVGSEWSPQFPGYVAGAIEAARLGVQAFLAHRPPSL
ncbi:flavin monoamine oxidase family protein [Paraburkholderia fungorum]|uniref:flavin monoamine oxidase family protein n=1 Tax=Paraburkholderia fungorum TaxID=134537 RepID=UPI00402BC7D7